LRHELAAVAASITLLAGSLWAAQGKDSHRFDPARVVSIAETMSPPECSVSGTVILEVTVEKTGGVGNIIVVRGVPKLSEEIDHLHGTLYIDRMHSRTFTSLDNWNRYWKGKPVSGA
jgi:hypothetical protein